LARIHEVLRQVRMPDPERIAGSYPIMLSGGMRQRVLIAMALLSEPRLLVADEPGTALDVTTQAQILKLLRDLVEDRSLALLMITHNLGVVRESADYVYVMYAGSVVEHGPTAELFAHPSHPYTRALIDCVPKLSGGTTFRGIDGSLPDYSAPPPGCRFSPRCRLATLVCERPPADTPVSADHSAACWHVDEAAA
jgi:peptide/nickel transport system ATP-binding protein